MIFFWFCITVMAVGGALKTVNDNWHRYSSNPTVINLEKNFRAWKVEFPAATICPLDRVDVVKAKKYIERTWGVKEDQEEKHKYYMHFVNSVSNLSYDSMENFEDFKDDKSLEGIDMATLSLTVLRNLRYSSLIFHPRYKHIKLTDTITEMGICYTYSGVFSNYISLRKTIEYDPSTEFVPPYCNFMNAVCYARLEDLNNDFKIYIHSPYGFPGISDNFITIYRDMELDVSMKASTTVAVDALRRLSPVQRKCRFMNEPMADMDSSVYTYDSCIMNCHKKFALQKCNCVPYFYGKSSSSRTCNVKGLACIAKYAREIKTLTYANKMPFPCSCVPLCQFTDYILLKYSYRTWVLPVEQMNANFRWGVEVYSKTRFKRDVIFSFEDLLVSFGGTASFFLGCSVMTLFEIFYLFTLRLFWYVKFAFYN